MENNNKLLTALKEKHVLNKIATDSDTYSLFTLDKEKNKNYIILRNGICSNDEISCVQNFIDCLDKKKFFNATFIFIAFVKEDFKEDEYLKFNGNLFLHTLSYNLTTGKFISDKTFYYWGSKKIKQFFDDIEQIVL